MCGGSRHTSALAQKKTQLGASFTNERVLLFFLLPFSLEALSNEHNPPI